MLDELELLKKDWQKKEEQLPKLSYNEIHTMLWKKSSSIVKWVLTISVLEFSLPHLLYLIPGMTEKNMDIYEKLGVKDLATTFWVLSYAITLYFIYLFYKRYKEISVLDSAKDLMEKIIKTRKTVKYYVIYGLSFLFLACALIFAGVYLTDNITDVFPPAEGAKEIAPEKFKNAVLWTIAIFSVVVVAVMGGIYFLLYGRLLRKLNKNYKELKRLEI
ncbi:FIG00654529: hypothetical protein [hydrothermal vent metagenome]|uniref:Uncharacterized protein n=1 Tax=hydrothermal vent metagenome TaxID=652676 RepID=A0A3B0T420_9ZZZZ